GGTSYLQKDQQQYLKNNGYQVQLNNLTALRTFDGNKVWSLFGKEDIPYDIDRNQDSFPSLEEMTTKAITTLSKNGNGFFLMVEGSKVDWAAHANDPIGMVTDFLAFDKACKVALDFAKKDGHTAVLILPDHGNSGISIGVNRLPGYSKLTKDQLFGHLINYERTSVGLAALIKAADHSQVKDLVRQYAHLNLSDKQLELIDQSNDYDKSPITVEQRKKGPALSSLLAEIMTDSTGFGFTTHGHTGEEVFMAAYHPQHAIPTGVRFNVEINDYLCQWLKIGHKLPELTSTYFAKHSEVFKGMSYTSDTTVPSGHPVLTVKHNGNTLKVTDDSNVVNLNGKDIQLNTVVVYVDKNQTYYLPEKLAKWLN
ncbi:MAG: alkaline phosphatase, partial [Bacteroidota bacterium]|nr:alkaline phosphatase [Bacteroidota bacterium]